MKYLLLTLIVLATTHKVYSAPIVMKHMPDGDKCIICHRRETPNQLLLRDGTKILPSEVSMLCGQCHGIKYRNWSKGRHGKVVGSWKPELRKRLDCTHCHDPHAPKFPSLQTKAPPPKLRGQ